MTPVPGVATTISTSQNFGRWQLAQAQRFAIEVARAIGRLVRAGEGERDMLQAQDCRCASHQMPRIALAIRK